MKPIEVFWADLSPVVGNEMGGFRPVAILSKLGTLRTAVLLRPSVLSDVLPDDPLWRCNYEISPHIRTIDTSRLKERIGILSPQAVKCLKGNLNSILQIISN